MSDYLKTYNTNEMRPVTDYLFRLAAHISQEYLDSSHKKLLDLGCGRGDQLRAFAALGYYVLGADNADSAREFCAPHKVVRFSKEVMLLAIAEKKIAAVSIWN